MKSFAKFPTIACLSALAAASVASAAESRRQAELPTTSTFHLGARYSSAEDKALALRSSANNGVYINSNPASPTDSNSGRQYTWDSTNNTLSWADGNKNLLYVDSSGRWLVSKEAAVNGALPSDIPAGSTTTFKIQPLQDDDLSMGMSLFAFAANGTRLAKTFTCDTLENPQYLPIYSIVDWPSRCSNNSLDLIVTVATQQLTSFGTIATRPHSG